MSVWSPLSRVTYKTSSGQRNYFGVAYIEHIIINEYVVARCEYY